MTMLKTHEDALDSSNTAYHEFLLYYRNDVSLVYGFVEGKDDPAFYKGLIEPLLGDGWSVKLIVAGNKRRVLDVLDGMDWSRFPERRVCFFVDRDLSDFVGQAHQNAGNLYVTDGYSLENSIIGEATLDRALEELMGIDGLSPAEYESIHQVFRANTTAFTDALTPVMAQILLWRRGGDGPSLDNLKLHAWFRFREGRFESQDGYVDSNARLDAAAEWCKLTRSSADDVAAAAAELLSKHEARLFIRGKYLLWFFVQCLIGIRESIARFCSKYAESPPRVRVSFGPQNAVVLLAGRVRTPATLKQFVERNYLSYVQGLPAG